MTEFLADLAAIGSSINKILASPAINTIPVRLDATLSHLESLSAKLDSRGGPLLGEMEAGLTELHQAINAVQSAMVKVGKAADQVEKFADADSKIAGSITRAGTELANASRQLDQLADEESPAVRQFTLSLQEISRAARALACWLKAWSGSQRRLSGENILGRNKNEGLIEILPQDQPAPHPPGSCPADVRLCPDLAGHLLPAFHYRCGPAAVAADAIGDATIGLGPIRLPELLDRPQIVIRTGSNRLQLAEDRRWAESLAENISAS